MKALTQLRSGLEDWIASIRFDMFCRPKVNYFVVVTAEQ